MTKKYMVKFLNEHPDWSSKPINQDFWAAFERYCRKQRKLEVVKAREESNPSMWYKAQKEKVN